MSQTAILVSIVSILGCLLLATRGLSGRNISFSRTATMALIWLAIIVGGTLFASWAGLHIG
ncbi:hypothetical protein [Novosphingobium colocasiae]|uniref:hypothetical protein n=1 Tax=Novosphingobium colocasiae TaxID=1256513 RepID=UPI0035B42162